MKPLAKSHFKNSIIDFINTLCNFIALNIIFLITCIPIITIGSALSALYFVTLKEARGEYGYLIRPYLKEFKKNIKSGTFAFLILFVVGAVVLFNLVFWYAMNSLLSMIILGVMILACIVYLLTFLYTFPLIGRFSNKTLQTLKNAFYLSLLHVKMTAGLLFIDSLVLCLCIFLPPMKLFMILFGFAFVAYCKSFLFIKVFASYEEDALSKIDFISGD
jgi:uncharacterized membrane protein YesL